jgi:hypothetical protein
MDEFDDYRFTFEDELLLRRITLEVRSKPSAFRDVGQAIDHDYSIAALRERRSHARAIPTLADTTEWRDDPNGQKLARLEAAIADATYLIRPLSEAEARHVCLLAWLVDDVDAHELDVELTSFQRLPWADVPDEDDGEVERKPGHDPEHQRTAEHRFERWQCRFLARDRILSRAWIELARIAAATLGIFASPSLPSTEPEVLELGALPPLSLRARAVLTFLLDQPPAAVFSSNAIMEALMWRKPSVSVSADYIRAKIRGQLEPYGVEGTPSGLRLRPEKRELARRAVLG